MDINTLQEVSDIIENIVEEPKNMQEVKSTVTQEFLKGFSELRNVSECDLESKIFDFLCWYELNKPYIHPGVSRSAIFFKIPELCFLYHVDESTLVSKVLQNIHCLPRIAVPHLALFLTLNCCRCTLPLELMKNRQKSGKPSFNFLAFFLHHSNVEKMLFDGKRLTEIVETTNPILYAKVFLFSDPKCVLTLLQYGLTYDTDEEHVKIHPIFPYITELLIEFAEGLGDLQIDLMGDWISYPERLLTLLENLNIILRTAYNPHRVIFEMLNYAKRQSVEEYELLYPFFRFLLPYTDFKAPCPSTLKHCCRYEVRKRLFDLWRLPYGIWQLNLKPDITSYLHLRTD